MKSFVVGALLALALVSGAVAEDARNVNIVNETGYGIKFLGFNNPGDDDWSDK
jgi:opacity protein-like surface antigen